ncbi:hypothetical protein OC844_004724 [Tilletia horrida]|nr:hypothetical protein OC844_004724 [Tilletia horrida]
MYAQPLISLTPQDIKMLQFPRKLLFGDDKLAFLSSPTGIPRLWRERHIPVPPQPNAHVYWASFTTVFDTPSDVFSLLNVSDIRRALDTAPENVASLVRLVAAHLESLIDDPAFCPQPARGAGRNLLTGWIPAIGGDANANKDGRDRVREALNCVRILTRLLPVIMEGTAAAQEQLSSGGALPYDPRHFSEFEYNLLWKRASQKIASVREASIEKPPLTTSDSDNQFVIDDGADDDDTEPTPGSAPPTDPLNQPSKSEDTASAASKPSALSSANEPPEPCFMEQLLEVCINLLFRSGFAVPWTDDQHDATSSTEEPSFVHLVIWYAGVGSSQELEGTTRTHESHRVEVLRLLLVILSKSMYIPVADQRSVSNTVAAYAVSRLDRTVVLPLLCSLLNAVSTHTREAGWLGGISNNRLLGGAEDVKATLTALSLQTLNVLVGYEHARGAIPPTPGTPGTAGTGASGRPGFSPFASAQSVPSIASTLESTAPNGAHWPSQKNSFRFYLSKLHRAQDFQNIWTSLCAILNAPMSASAAFLPLVGPNALGGGLTNAAAGVYVPEAMMLLWRMTLHNAKFRAFVLDDEDGGKRSLTLLSFLLFHALAGKDLLQRHGLVRLCAFMLQDLSAEKAFGLHISKPGSGSLARLPSRFGIVGTNAGNGSGADVLIQAIYSLIATTKGSLSSLYPPLVISLTNTAPYWRNMTVTSATRLSQLLRSFSSAAYLLADEGNPRNLFYLLEAITFVLQYHFANNANFAYALVRSGPIVDKLATFTLRRGIADIRRRRARAGLILAPPTPTAGGGPNSTTTTAAPGRSASGSVAGSRVTSLGGSDTPAGILSPALPSSDAAGVQHEEKDPVAAAGAMETDNEKTRLAQREAELEAAAAQQALSLDDTSATANSNTVPSGAGAGAGAGAEARVLSDKARGKLRQSSISFTLEGAGIGPDGTSAVSHQPAGGEVDSGSGVVAAGTRGSSVAGDERSQRDEEVDELIFSLTEEELFEAARTVGRHGFVPTQEWVTSWQKGLPLDTIQLALTELKPKVETLCASESVLNKTDADERVLAFLREQTLAGVLPPAPSIVTRPFRWTDQSQVWLTSYLWGCIYAFAVLPHAIWRDTEVRLFQVLEPPSASGSGAGAGAGSPSAAVPAAAAGAGAAGAPARAGP